MELKTYQKKVIADLNSYLDYLNKTEDLTEAFKGYWSNRNVTVGFGSVPAYQNNIEGTPHICFKVPTGGGKTYLACSALKPIYENIRLAKKMVVWLVPSNTILEQTIRNLKDPRHPYRQAINRDFSGAVEVYSKDELLMAQSFNPTSVLEQLSIAVLSYDSLRARKKDDRKMYQENSNLDSFVPHYQSPDTLIENVDETALMQVINQLNPVIIVDESHNAISDLSVEMLKNLNPSFILDLTATPKKNSNVICYVDAKELKKANMIKLPVIVYNRPQKQDVLIESIAMRDKLEQAAIKDEETTGRYIRPIVLFQAQPKNKEDSETFDKIKDSLVELGIPENQIAIKTADINQIKNIDLLSRDCEIRYIITVNALKEGWDCPFAYILATLANKTSKVDVEQIVGRILRQPYTKKAGLDYLNLSYVITSSNDFRSTLNSVVEGLNKSGFNAEDVRVDNAEADLPEPILELEGVQEALESGTTGQPEDDYLTGINLVEEKMRLHLTRDSATNAVDQMLEHAKQEGENYTLQMEEEDKYNADIPFDLKGNINQFNVQPAFFKEIKNLYLPQFYIKIDDKPSLFYPDGLEKLEKEHLTKGFILNTQDANIGSNIFGTGEVAEVDIDFDSDPKSKTRPKYRAIAAADERYYRDILETKPPEEKRKAMVDVLVHNIKINAIDDEDLRKYIQRVIEHFTNDQLSALISSPTSYAAKIKRKILSLMEEYQEETFNLWYSKELIQCERKYQLPSYITPMQHSSNIAGSLYEAERDDMNDLEHEVITKVSALENVVWWHRIIEKNDFCINGFINHYPDFMIRTQSGKIILIESKGEPFLQSSDSMKKIELGQKWENSAGRNDFRYFMVSKENKSEVAGVVNIDTLRDIISRI